MEAWEILWKGVLLAGLAVFAVMAVWVTVAGFDDLRQLLRSLKRRTSSRKER